MKLKNIIAAFLATMTLAIGCESEAEYLDEVRVSSSYVAIPAAGGDQTITVNAKAAWSIEDAPEWITITPAS